MVSFSDATHQVEICRNCGRKMAWKHGEVGKERGFSGRYARAHVKAFCQPWGPTRNIYAMLHRNSVSDMRMKLLASDEQKRKDRQTELTDRYRWAMKNDNWKPDRSWQT